MKSQHGAGNLKRQLNIRPPKMESLENREMLSTSAVIPLAGDFDGDGTDTVGFYDPDEGKFLVRNQNNSGFAEAEVRFGPQCSSMLPLIGDWDGDGDETPALYDPSTGSFFLKNSFTPGAADVVFGFGPSTSSLTPISGDWDGDGDDNVGLYDPVAGTFFLKNDLTPGAADATFNYGAKNQGWLPITGDWDNNNTDTIGLYDQTSGKWFLKNSNSAGTADEVFGYGPKPTTWLPLAGDWDGNTSITIGLHDPAIGQFYLRNTRTAGPADLVFHVAPSLDVTLAPSAMVGATISAAEVQQLLARAAGASASEDAIIAVVDRNGTILGVRAEADVLTNIPDPQILTFAIDGAVAKARTAAYFANGDPDNGTTTPLTSRLVRFISQSTITEREVNSNPNSSDPLVRGPGFVAPIGLGGHFPPEIDHTPPVDLFAIEHTNRDGTVHPGPDFVRDTVTLNPDGSVNTISGDDILLQNRFNADSAFIPAGQDLTTPDSYGFASGIYPEAQSRGIATLPGGIPIFRDTNADGVGDTLIGGIGVFFPGTDGYATFEQGYVAGIGQSEFERINAPRVLESEWIAFAAVGGSSLGGAQVGALDGVAVVTDFDLPAGRLTLVGIELEVFGPHPDGVWELVNVGTAVGQGDSTSGADQIVNPMGAQYLAGALVPEGWIVLPHGSAVDNLTADDVNQIITNGIQEALAVRAAVRLPVSSRTRMIFSVADTEGNILGLYRMRDATVFSLDVAAAKARNTAYYADATAIQTIDRVDDSIPPDGIPDLPTGVAFTNRTFRFIAEARFPDGVDGAVGPFSILNDPGTDPLTAESTGAPEPAANHTSVLGFDAFNPGSNFRDPDNIANQNGVIFFPGSTPIYKNNILVGGLGVSGDGVDQDDVVTFFAAQDFLPEAPVLRADDVFVRDVRLPYVKFLRNPEG